MKTIKLKDKDGNEFLGEKTPSGKNIEEIVQLIKPKAYWSSGGAGGFWQDFFLMPGGRVVSFFPANGTIFVSSVKYTKKYFTNKLEDDFCEQNEETESILFANEIKNIDKADYPDKEYSDVEGIVRRIGVITSK